MDIFKSFFNLMAWSVILFPTLQIYLTFLIVSSFSWGTYQWIMVCGRMNWKKSGPSTVLSKMSFWLTLQKLPEEWK